MRSKSIIWTLAIAAFLALPATTFAQASQSVGGTATVEIIPFLNLVNTTGFDFGQHYAADGVVTSGLNVARWDGSTDPGNDISITFTLPNFLSDGGGSNIPITFGSASGHFSPNGGTSQVFNPATGVASANVPLTGNGTFLVWLGSSNAGQQTDADIVKIDVTGKQPSIYTGTMTLTVAVL